MFTFSWAIHLGFISKFLQWFISAFLQGFQPKFILWLFSELFQYSSSIFLVISPRMDAGTCLGIIPEFHSGMLPKISFKILQKNPPGILSGIYPVTSKYIHPGILPGASSRVQTSSRNFLQISTLSLCFQVLPGAPLDFFSLILPRIVLGTFP